MNEYVIVYFSYLLYQKTKISYLLNQKINRKKVSYLVNQKYK